MANLHFSTRQNRRSWLDGISLHTGRVGNGPPHRSALTSLCLAALLVAAAATLPRAAAQVGPELAAPQPRWPARSAATVQPVGPAPTDALATPADNVVDVKIAGNKTLPLEKILPSIRTRAGRPFNLELIAEDVRRLDHTISFST